MDRTDTTVRMFRRSGRNEEFRVCYKNVILGDEIKADETVGYVS